MTAVTEMTAGFDERCVITGACRTMDGGASGSRPIGVADFPHVSRPRSWVFG
jgi:hypothetical protein